MQARVCVSAGFRVVGWPLSGDVFLAVLDALYICDGGQISKGPWLHCAAKMMVFRAHACNQIW